jgi:TPR repeat protein/serine/threonine protein kinase
LVVPVLAWHWTFCEAEWAMADDAFPSDPAALFARAQEIGGVADSSAQDLHAPQAAHAGWRGQEPTPNLTDWHMKVPAGFELFEELGRGGMGVVYRARGPAGRDLAMKIAPRAQKGVALERFRREGEITSKLEHPGIVRVHSMGSLSDGVPYVAYELVKGARPLQGVFAELELVDRVELVLDAALAVAHAHSQGVVHRDLKSDNVLVGADGKLRVADFGLALASGDSRLTKTGALVGTPTHMSPELLRGSKFGVVSPATDVWALGVILYHALTGRLPFLGESIQAIAEAVSAARPVRPSAIARVPKAFEAVCLKALRSKPSERYETAGAFAEALEQALRPGTGKSAGGGGRGVLLALAAGLGVLLVIGAAWFTSRPDPALISEAPKASPTSPSPPPVAEPIKPVLSVPERAQQGDVEAMFEMGRRLSRARPPDPESAIRWFRLAADAGHPAAMRSLALILSTNGDRADMPEAMAWLRKAAAAGDAQAMFNLGAMMQTNSMGPGDMAKSVEWLQKAYAGGYVKAANNLGMSYDRGLGVKADPRQAAEWYRRGAEGGDLRAMNNIAVLYMEGQGVKKSAEAAFTWFWKAAQAGDAPAMMNLGLMYQQGLGVKKDEADGFRWFQRAGAAGSARAHAAIGSSYEAGRGVPVDREKAIAAYRLAARQGDTFARNRLRKLGVE